MLVDYTLIALDHEKATWRGTFAGRDEAVAEARRIADAENVRVIIDREDEGDPLCFDPTPRYQRAGRARR